MKKNISILLAMLLAVLFQLPANGQIFLCHDATPTFAAQDGICDSNPLILVFQDNFDGTSLDLTKWKAIDFPQRDPDFEQEKQWYQPSNLEVSNGTLKIIARLEFPAVHHDYVLNGVPRSEDFNYTSGEIDSRSQFGDGYYEIRCKIPKGKGLWPAFWGFAYGISMDEIDVFEFWNENTLGIYDPLLLARKPNRNLHNNASLSCSDDYYGPDFSADFHTFGLYRDDYIIQWSVDGVVKRTDFHYLYAGVGAFCNQIHANDFILVNPLFPRDPMTIIANLAIKNGSNLPDANTPFPCAYEIDYIRCYKRLPCTVASQSLTITSASNLNSYYGISVTTSGTVSLPSGRQLNLKADDKVVLNPGFNGNSGCNFVAQITSCPERVHRVAAPDLQMEPTNTQTNSSPNAGNSVNAFPNPTSGKISLEVNGSEERNVEISILSPLGKEILNVNMGKIIKGYQEVDLSNEPEGMYLAKIKSGSDITYKKIILTR
jgi:beta-glucanase (GH16 family)